MLRGSDLSQFQPSHAKPLPSDRFWYIRVGDGTTYVDKAWAAHHREAQKAGIAVGNYLYVRPRMNPVMQASRLAKAHRAGDLPPALDIERTDGLGPTAMAVVVDQAVRHLVTLLRMPVVVYTNPATGKAIDWQSVSTRSHIILWHAEWGPRLHRIPGAPAPLFWQYANHGGAGGGDADYFLGDQARLDSLRRQATTPTTKGRPHTMAEFSDWLRYQWIPAHYAPHLWDSVWRRISVQKATELWHRHGGRLHPDDVADHAQADREKP